MEELAKYVQLQSQEFRWRTMDGRVLTITEMETKHVFNSMKMCFNHLAEAWSARPVWFTKKYSDYASAAIRKPEQLAWLVVFFMVEIDRRGNLPAIYAEPYRQIKSQVANRGISLPQMIQQGAIQCRE